MNIRASFNGNQSKRNTTAIVNYIGSDPKRFAELVVIMFDGDHREVQCAAWPVSVVAEKNPQLLTPYLSRLVDMIPRMDIHNGARRGILRALQFVEIPTRLKGRVYSYCIDRISDPNEAVGVRGFALTVAAKIAREEPELLNELRLVVKTHLPKTQFSFRVRSRDLEREL